MIVGSCAGSLYSLDRKTGDTIWIYDTKVDGSAAQFHGEPLVMSDRVVVPTDAEPKGHVYSFETASGDLLWKVPFDNGVATTPLLVGDKLIVVSAGGEVAAIEPKDGKVIWKTKPAGDLKPLPFTPSPAYVANRIIVADNTNQILALDPQDGTTVWRKNLSSRANTALVPVGDLVAVGTSDGQLTWIAGKSGEVQKRVDLGLHPYGTPIRADGLLFFLAGNKSSKLLALDAATGAVRWQQETANEWTTYRPLVTGSVVIAGDSDKTLCAFDRTSGERRWCRPVGQIPRGVGISSDGILYVGSLSGVVQAFPIDSAAR